MMTRTSASIPLALIAVLIVSLQPALRATAASDETDWTKAFEKAKRESPGFAVESVEEFRKLTGHYESVLSDGVAIKSFELPNGDQIRCVEISSQRSLAASGHPLQLAPGTLPAGETGTTPSRPGLMGRPGAEFGLDGTKDAAGNERACPAKTFPKLMPRLENLYRFRRLEDLFQKTPGGGGDLSAGPNAPVGLVREPLTATVHEYAHAYQWVNNTGMSADFNLWSPTVEDSDEFSLSQLWVARGLKTDNSLQTVETGWQNYQQKYHDSRSHLFIYYTTGNYQTGTGCYNLDCTGFVQTDSSVPIGGGYTVYSTQGGPQYSFSLASFRDASPPHNWWLKYGETWLGYYPNSLFDSQGIASYSDRIDFGGEIVDNQIGGLHTTTQMGSGHFPSEGFGHAAYIKKIQYWDTSGPQFNATGLNPDVTNASYYDLSLGSSTDSSWLRYFYFGGPGRVASAAPTASFTLSANPKAGQPVQFTDTSTGSPTSWSWNFGDGGTSTVQNPTHTYASAGTFSTTLTAANSSGSSSKTQSVTVTANVTAPVASFTWSPNPAFAGQPVQFTDTSTGSPTSWTWNFGDSGGSSLQNPTHTFAAAGSYTVGLAVSNSASASSRSQTVTVGSSGTGTTATKFVPIVLDVGGSGGSRFSTELTLANRGGTTAAVQLAYTPATALNASGSGVVTTSLAARKQMVIPDTIGFLRSGGLAIPADGSNQGGTLRVTFSGLSSADVAYVGARTTTPSGTGRAGLSYPGVRPEDCFTDFAWLYGLRENGAERTNLALANANASSAVTLRVNIWPADGGEGYYLTPDVTLGPGQWTQIGRVLDIVGFTAGRARVDLISGSGPFYAYGVFNDNVTNDGSYVLPTPNSYYFETQTIPVLVETPTFSSEMVLANYTSKTATVSLSYTESLSPNLGAGGTVMETLAPWEQRVVPDAIQHLRSKGLGLPPKGSGSFAGALNAVFMVNGTKDGGFVGARTGAPAPSGGQYGLFYSGVGPSSAAGSDAWVFGLQENSSVRSNVAVVNLGGGDTPITFRIQVYNGDTGQLAGTTSDYTLGPGGWKQLGGLLPMYGATNGYVRVIRASGSSDIVAYGVVNDGASSSSGATNDGSYIAFSNR